MREVLLVGVGGFLGAVSRYLVGGWVQGAFPRSDFPLGTLVVNVAGSFAIGFLFGLGDARGVFGPTARLFWAMGFLGAFTTFSSFSLETVNLATDGDGLMAVANVLANVLGCLVAVLAARLLVQAAWGGS
jgi:fluoride exporter